MIMRALASPFVLQISGTKENSVSIAILPAEQPLK
jgi:hypothetical protein